MPAGGGSADKLGNRYEALWAVDQLLRIVAGAALRLTLEPLDPDKSRGIEFIVATDDNATEYWSVKRQTTKAAGWTLARLAEKDDRGRSILRDLFQHVERDATAKGVFASTLGARDFEELRENAENQSVFDARLDQSKSLKLDFRQYILPLCRRDTERARTFLIRTRTHACDEPQLRDRVHFAIRRLFHIPDGSALDAATVRGWLAELLLDNIHRPIDRDRILGALATHGLRLREWVERTVRDRINDLCTDYTKPLQSQLINGAFLPLEGSERLLGLGSTPPSQNILVVGGAGAGKSSSLASVVARLRGSSIPVLAIRFDQLPEGLLTTTELGGKLLLPESPALVLAGVAAGKPCVLIIDQLDAVSITSGRRAELWTLFDRLHREVERFPNMSLIVGCREFDLDHDHRMRAMKATTSGFSIETLKPLSLEQIETALRAAEIDARTVQQTLKPILAVPLHLSMFLSLAADDRVAVRSRDELFDAFWVQGEHRTDLRLGRKTAWTQVIDSLANRLSETQQLSAPQHVLDDFRTDAAAMASEHILVFADGRYRFFHESFFDYAFARRFAARGSSLLDLLLRSEQHLFRRAQVRQILAYLRAHDWPRYVTELSSVLLNPGVRFHIKRLVFQWLSSMPDPQNQEWGVLEELLLSAPDQRVHVRALVAGHAGWFDILDNAGFFDAALSTGDSTRAQEVIWMFGFRETLKSRSARVAAFLQKHRRSDDSWRRYLIRVVRTGDVYHAPEMFALFLSLIDDGTLDRVRSGFAVNDDWWSLLYSMARDRPELASEAIGRWFDRALNGWRSLRHDASASADTAPAETRNLDAYLDGSGTGAAVIHGAANSPLSFVEHLLPRVAALVSETAEERRDRLQRDPLWSSRWFGDGGHEIHDAILSGLTRSLEALAKAAPAKLDHSLAPYRDRPHDTIAYLVLRAWTAAPDLYADQLAEYLATDPRRLKVGYAASGGGGGSPEIYASSQAVRAASTRCSSELFAALEQAIVALTDYWEARYPPRRGLMQLELLESLDHSRLSPAGRARLEELRRKFPRIIQEPPRPMRVVTVKSPIAEDAQAKMSDEQWLRAMRKYAGAQWRWASADGASGGERQLAHSIQQRATTDPVRFAMLAQRMQDDLPASYFDAILLGVTQASRTEGDANSSPILLPQVVSLVRRAHALPGRPCGRFIAWLIETRPGGDWPEDLVDATAWYAVNDSDPEATPTSDTSPHGDSVRMDGINSTRGAISQAVAHVLFDEPERFGRLHDTAYSLTHDRSIAVRSCAIDVILAVLNIQAQTAISWFRDSAVEDPRILAAPYVERFIHFAGYRDYPALRPVIDAMLSSATASVVEVAARQVCVLALSVEAADIDADLVRRGTPTMRKAAAKIYAANVADDAAGRSCRELVKSFFADPDDAVRAEAASAFLNLARLKTFDQSDLLAAFLGSTPGPTALKTVVRALEESPVQLPDLVCRLAEMCVTAYRDEAGDISTESSMVAMDLSKIVVRLYAQTEAPMIQSRCLDLIDEMERHHFVGLSDELCKIDR